MGWRPSCRWPLRAARRGCRQTGVYVPLESQDPALWDPRQIDWGERLLQRAHACGAVGRFQLEAAIQSVHVARARTGATDWAALALLYEGLMRVAPAIGTAVGRAIAVGHSQGAAAGLAALEQIDAPVREAYPTRPGPPAPICSRWWVATPMPLRRWTGPLPALPGPVCVQTWNDAARR